MVEMEGKMVKVFGVLAISIWVILVEPSIPASDLSLDVGSSPTMAMYSKLLNDIRDKVKDPKLKYGGTDIPVMAAESPKTPKLLLVDLKASNGTITIVISTEDKFNLYVQGYLERSKNNNEEIIKAHIFPDASVYAKKYLSSVATPPPLVEMKYKSAYVDIEKKAGDRSKLVLGVPQLNKLINNVYGKPLDVKTEAQLMLLVIQMLAEATRFKYIEKMILKNFDSFGYKPDPKTINLQTNWQTITRRIKSSKNGVISPVLDLIDDGNKPWKVSKVSEIAPDMGLLKYEGKQALTRNTLSWIPSQFYLVE